MILYNTHNILCTLRSVNSVRLYIILNIRPVNSVALYIIQDKMPLTSVTQYIVTVLNMKLVNSSTLKYSTKYEAFGLIKHSFKTRYEPC